MSIFLELQLAKPVMENEEGLNHLWIKWHGSEHFEGPTLKRSQPASLIVSLPEGIQRSANLNGLDEDVQQRVAIDLTRDTDVLIELYTESAVPCGKTAITAILMIAEQQTEAFVSIELTDADDTGEITVNKQVVERLKQLRYPVSASDMDESNGQFISIPPRWTERRPNEYDYLVEKYRIDCMSNMLGQQ